MRTLSRALVVLGSVTLLIGLVAGVVNRQVLDGGRFAGHVDAIREDPQVARQIGLLVTDRILAQEPDLTGLRPLLESASATLVASPALGPVVRGTVAPLHDALTSDDGGQVILRLADVGALLVTAITTLAPQTEAAIPPDLDVTLASIGAQELTGDLIEAADDVALLAAVLPVLGLLMLVAAGALDRRGWRGVVRATGTGALGAAGVLVVLLLVASWWASRLDDSIRDALVAAAWRELDGSFWAVAGVVAAAGLLMRLVASPGLDLDPSTLASRGWRTLSGVGSTPRTELFRGGAVVLVGGLMVVRPLLVLSLVGVIAGAALVLIGARSLLRVGAAWWVARRPDRVRRDRQGLVARAGPIAALAGAVALVAAFVVGAWPAGRDLPAFSATDGTACNGHRELCDRRFDEVSYAGTHNSMAAADQPGWFLAEQPYGILRQLDDGIRVLLIDSWNGQGTERPGVIANAGADRKKALAEARATYGTRVLQSALRIRDALDLTPTGPVRPYLCHALCELGSTDWEPLMVQVKTWLDRHPREVVTFFVQDEVSPEDTAALVRRAGLASYVHTPVAGQPWPTLGEMIASGRRVVFLLENASGGSADPWLIDARTAVQDTPYSFRRPSEFTCTRFRGPADASLFLVNHWLSNFDSRVTDAAKVNAEDVLWPRLKTCEAERGRRPNFVAVDYYDRGDLLRAVDRLNGVS
ncbi:PI-PLC domain-containing protein [Aeromicrobium wangtongii]|uniref:Uncharacterized protein n=1 Tax=Aeromicrobium wangtongii TaxID=2969247 RepID=A0ABY5MDV4_9ACTN|nr:hypothetical protein [Aeromicrobium wangtongii]MCD9199655.1 hypothetical protein [Aeromicrobium wangtongii]UUP14006.1 hypothetical protein NQV15_01465 [Aeromicrobium wangtongii]